MSASLPHLWQQTNNEEEEQKTKQKSQGKLITDWEKFDLSSRRPILDKQALVITKYQDARQDSRKRLAEKTREYHKLSLVNKEEQLPGLIKSYQEVIDTLSERSKFVESNFLELYRSLATLPDPVPALASLNQAKKYSSELAAVELRNRQLQAELA